MGNVDGDLRAYVDGSFINGRTTYGAAVVRGDQVIAELSGVVLGAESSHQVAGEIAAVEAALRWCAEMGETAIEIYYDLEGLEYWATGVWKANLPLTRTYQQTVRTSGVTIRWHKVEAHSGDRWNEHVDQLAKGAGAAETARAPLEIPAEAAERLARGFVAYLQGQDIEAGFDRIVNQMAARIRLAGGVADVYHTEKKPRRIDVHALPAGLQVDVNAQWATYLATLDGAKPVATRARPLPIALRDAAYYRELLAPWASYPLDFSDFAHALERPAQEAGLAFDIAQARFDFSLLERLFEQIKDHLYD